MPRDGHPGVWRLLAIALCAACGSAGPARDAADAAAGTTDAGSGDGFVTPTDSGQGADGTGIADGTSPDAGSGSPDGGSASSEAGDAGGPAYDQNGPVAFTTTSAMVQNGADSFTENIYLPSSAGTHPLVSLTPGLQQPTAAYAPYSERLASYGIVVLVRDDPGLLTQSQVIAADLEYVIATWLPAQNADASSPLYGAVDLTKVGLTGHSRGGQASLLAAEGSLLGHVVAWFGIDPDGPGTIDGFVESTQLAAPMLGTIGIPTTFLGGQVATFCTPANINYQVLYDAAPSPSVLITAVDASHTEFEVQSSCVDCALCTPMGSANQQVVLAYAVRYLTAFFARELLGDTSVGTTFQGAGGPADQAAGLVQITSK
jgi:dienelactone hydrolase